MIEDYGKKGIDPTYSVSSSKIHKSQEIKVEKLSSALLSKRSQSFIRRSKNLCAKVTAKPRHIRQKRKAQNAVDEVATILNKTGRAEDYDKIANAINHTIAFALTYRKPLIRPAVKKKQSIYLSPKAINQFLKKQKSESDYQGCHIQVNTDGTMYVIPKTEEFKLGYGAFKRVRLAVELGSDGKPKRAIAFARVSVKQIEKSYREVGRLREDQSLSPKQVKDIYQDICSEVAMIRNMIELRGKQLGFSVDDVKFSVYGTDEGFTKADFVMPLCELGDFEKPLKSMDERREATMGCVKCVKEWHEKGYVHVDIKPSNFLGTRNLEGKLEVHSFDLAFSYNPSDLKKRERKGTLRYLAPEAWDFDKHIDSFKADIFSLGITLYQIMNISEKSSEFPPFIIEAQKGIKSGSYQRDLRGCWKNFYAKDGFEVLIKAMTHPNPSKRPDIQKVEQLLSEIQEKSILPKDVAAKLKIPRGKNPKNVGHRLAKKLINGEDGAHEEAQNKIHSLWHSYSIENMVALYTGFEEILGKDGEGNFEAIFTTLQTLKEEKQGVIPYRPLTMKDIAHFNQRRYSLDLYEAVLLIGLRTGAWTFFADTDGDRCFMVCVDEEIREMNFDAWSEERKIIDLEAMRSVLSAINIDPNLFVPKSFPEG